jgi:hypothetical protein
MRKGLLLNANFSAALLFGVRQYPIPKRRLKKCDQFDEVERRRDPRQKWTDQLVDTVFCVG